MPIVELLVNIDCAGCESKVRKTLLRLKGVHSVDVDRTRDKVTVTGAVDQKKVLKTVRKTSKTAVFWPNPYNPEHHTYAPASHYRTKPAVSQVQYYYEPHEPSHVPARRTVVTADASSYNYRVHGYLDSHLHGYYHEPGFSSVVPGGGGFFSDDDPNACSIM